MNECYLKFKNVNKENKILWKKEYKNVVGTYRKKKEI